MSKLWVQLSLGFAAVTLVSVLTLALLTNNRADATFRTYLVQTQMLNSGLPEALGAAYAQDGDWRGAAAIISALSTESGSQHGQGQGWGNGQGARGRNSASLTLTDPNGAIIYPTGGGELNRSDLATATPIWVENSLVGYLFAHEQNGAALPQAAERFLSQINLAIVEAGLIAGLSGIALGLLIARNVSAPLAHLASAARRLATGHLDQRVPIAGPSELAAVGSAFNDMASALEAAESQRRHIVADIAHELRTPLTVIEGNLRAILDDVYPLSKAEIATIYDNTIGLHRLVDDLRELSLAESGHLHLHREATAIGPLLERTIALFGEPAASRAITLQLTVAPDLPLAQIDSERIRQVLTNFMVNALRHTPSEGQISLSAQTDPSRPGHILIAVSDNGQGIAAADLPHVFERFWRADRSRSRSQGGSGLGLAIAQQIIHLHNGHIGVESVVSQGSRFWISLPSQG